jgi:histidinol-phosphate phosphatase family protein
MKKHPQYKKPLLLLDRDGTLIEEMDYLSDPKQVHLLPGVVDGLKQLKRAGFLSVVVSNQAGVGRGFITLSQMRRVNRRFLQLLKLKKAPINGLYLCPHSPSDRCACRKPKLGMVRQAAKDLGVSWKRSLSVGDRLTDVELGQKTGGLGILVLTGYGRQWAKKKGPVRPDHIAFDFSHAVTWIIRRQERKNYESRNL